MYCIYKYIWNIDIHLLLLIILFKQYTEIKVFVLFIIDNLTMINHN